MTSRAALADDVVLLKGGGRLRGTVVEETKKSVRIRLLDGTMRELKPQEVDCIDYEGTGAAAPPPPAPPPLPEPAAPPAAPVQSAPRPISPPGRGGWW